MKTPEEYRTHLASYKTFRKHIKALSHKKKKQTLKINVRDMSDYMWGFSARKLYYWILKLWEENLIHSIKIEQAPSTNSYHHADSETYECIIYIGITPSEKKNA